MSTGNSPRWTCRVIRTWRAVRPAALDPNAGTAEGIGWIGRHIARCAVCQAYFHRAARLEAALRAEAATQPAPAADDLEFRVLRAVAAARQDRPVRRHADRPLWVLAGVAAVVAIVLATAQLRRSMAPRPPTPAPLVATGGAEPNGLGEAESPLVERPLKSPVTFAVPQPTAEPQPTDSLAALTPVGAVLAENPLQTEARSVYADARYAVRFLALNFLPSDLLAENGPAPRRDSSQNGG